jgi:beta-galactosidase
MQSKTETALWGPAALDYADQGARCLENWETVDLPHDYIIRQEPKRENNNTLGYFDYHNAWYRRHFQVPESDRGRRLLLEFEGIATHAVVYVNGCLMQRNFCGYTSFTVDISDIVRFGEKNVIAVHVIATEHEGWWYEGAGIYRHVWLVKTESVAIDQWGVWVNPSRQDAHHGRCPWKRRWSATPWKSAAQRSSRQSSARGKASQARPASWPYGQKPGVLRQAMAVTDPLLWDTETPHLYTLRTQVRVGGIPVDQQETAFGFRTIRFDADKGFFLNDKPVKIRGVCCHQDYGLTGKAMPDRVHHYRLRRLKEMGANGYRTAHYPPAEATMDALDRLGFLVMDETRWFPEHAGRAEPAWRCVSIADRNPALVVIIVGRRQRGTAAQDRHGRRLLETLTAFVHRYDMSRPVTTAISHDPLHTARRPVPRS